MAEATPPIITAFAWIDSPGVVERHAMLRAAAPA